MFRGLVCFNDLFFDIPPVRLRRAWNCEQFMEGGRHGQSSGLLTQRCKKFKCSNTIAFSEEHRLEGPPRRLSGVQAEGLRARDQIHHQPSSLNEREAQGTLGIFRAYGKGIVGSP